jgi:hypothetical protein
LLPAGPKNAPICLPCMQATSARSIRLLRALAGGQYAIAFIWPKKGQLEHRAIVTMDFRPAKDWPPGCPACRALAIYREQRLAELNAKVNGIIKAVPQPGLEKGESYAFAA